MKVVTDFRTLMSLAKIQGQCFLKYRDNKSEQNRINYEVAKQNHEEYKKLVLESDECSLGCTFGDLY